MKKVLMLCASPRKESNTMQVLEECSNKIAENGLEAEIVSLRQMKIRSCIACGKCAGFCPARFPFMNVCYCW